MKLTSVTLALALWLPNTVTAWLPSGKVRGVNLGSQFIFEPWIAQEKWSKMGCSNQKSEFDCVSSLGQDKADKAFKGHWASWITKDDISQMKQYGLNTIRIPVGYWMKEDLVDSSSEHFPKGGFDYLAQVCEWARDENLYVIIGLHGAPGAQTPKNPFTGQYANQAGFYTTDQYDRALEFLEWMATNVHKDERFKTVGMLEVVNEPLQNAGQVESMRKEYYPQAFVVRFLISSFFFFFFLSLSLSWGTGVVLP